MNINLKIGLAFTAGIAVGGLGAWFGFKKKFEQMAEQRIEEEINSIRETFDNLREELISGEGHLNVKKAEKPTTAEKVAPNTPVKPDIRSYNKILKEENYKGPDIRVTPAEDKSLELELDEFKPLLDKTGDILDEKEPFVISESEAGSISGWDFIQLTYHVPDKLLADDQGLGMNDEETIKALGSVEVLDQLHGDDELLYVRNPKREVDYEVLATYETYAEFRRRNKYLDEFEV